LIIRTVGKKIKIHMFYVLIGSKGPTFRRSTILWQAKSL